MFVISHDRYFLNKVPDQILVLEDQSVKSYLGNYDYYIEKRAAEKAALEFANQSEDTTTKTQLKIQRKKDKEKEKEEKKLKKQITETEEAIHNTELEIENLNELLCLEEIYSNPEKVKEVAEQKSDKEKILHELMSTWEMLLEAQQD